MDFASGAACKQARPTFTRGPHSSKQGPHSSKQGPHSFKQGPQSFKQGPQSFKQGPHSFEQGPHSFKQGPDSFKQGPQSSVAQLCHFVAAPAQLFLLWLLQHSCAAAVAAIAAVLQSSRPAGEPSPYGKQGGVLLLTHTSHKACHS